VLVARDAGGVRGRDLLVPAYVDLAPDPQTNRGLLVLRVAHAATIRKLRRGLSPPTDPVERLKCELLVALQAAECLADELGRFEAAWREACQAVLAVRPDPSTLGPRARGIEAARCAVLRGERPSDELWEQIRKARNSGKPSPPVPLWGGLLTSDVDDQTQGASPHDAQAPDGTEATAPPVEDIKRVLLDPKEQEKKVLQHTFEKVETLDSTEGNVLKADGSDELDEHLEALDEVDLRELLRGGDDAHSIFRADLDLGANIPDVESIGPNERGLPYDEWNERARSYKVGWCTVYPSRIQSRDASWAREPLIRHRALIDHLRRRLQDHRSRLQPRDRQLDGEHPDISALVDHHAEVGSGHSGSQRLYIRQQRQRRDISTTILLDLSLSSDAWVDNRRVLDISREAVLVLGEVAESLGDNIQVLAFASSTRNRCRVWTVKGWKESWPTGRDRLGVLEPQGYTRIGAALRHATDDLAKTPADQRLLLLISDGKPSDYDRYEGKYGIADVRMALREADRDGVHIHTLAIDKTASAMLPAMFGPGRWHVLPTPDHLLTTLTTIYGRLTSG
jgi:nitric oxide reductase NorD protein